MLIDKEVIGTMEISLNSVDNLFIRTEYGTHYVIARDLDTNKIRSQQVFQDFNRAEKYYEYFKEGYAKPKTYGHVHGDCPLAVMAWVLEQAVKRLRDLRDLQARDDASADAGG